MSTGTEVKHMEPTICVMLSKRLVDCASNPTSPVIQTSFNENDVKRGRG